jgi:hypothetical protein
MPSLQTSSAGFALVALTSWAVAAAHPQTVFDSARLTQLRSQRSDSAHSAMTSFASQFLTTHNVANSGSCPADIASSTIGQVGGYAVLAEILQQNVSDAVTYLNCFCGQSWDTGVDIAEAQQLAAAAIAYDVLYNDGVSSSCATRIATAANDFYSAYSDPSNPNGWWRTDIANNHIAVNMAALGIAAEALKGENANAPTWLSAVDQAYQKIAAVRDQSTDGSWHEGAEYQFFEMHYAALYFLGAARAGNPDRSATQMFLNAGKYFLQKQRPNNPRFITETPGDWNWTRPKFVAVMRFVAGHLASVDPTLAGYAQTVANRWDLQPRASQTFWLNRFEYAMSYALEYVAFDETVAATDPSISLPLANYNDNEGSFMMRSSWGVATSGSDSQGIVLTLKNGYLGGKGMAPRRARTGSSTSVTTITTTSASTSMETAVGSCRKRPDTTAAANPGPPIPTPSTTASGTIPSPSTAARGRTATARFSTTGLASGARAQSVAVTRPTSSSRASLPIPSTTTRRISPSARPTARGSTATSPSPARCAPSASIARRTSSS